MDSVTKKGMSIASIVVREYQYTTNGNVLIKLAIVGATDEQLEFIKYKARGLK